MSSAICSYQLGTGEVRACEKPPCAGHGNGFLNDAKDLQQRISGLEEDLVKVRLRSNPVSMLEICYLSCFSTATEDHLHAC